MKKCWASGGGSFAEIISSRFFSLYREIIPFCGRNIQVKLRSFTQIIFQVSKSMGSLVALDGFHGKSNSWELGYPFFGNIWPAERLNLSVSKDEQLGIQRRERLGVNRQKWGVFTNESIDWDGDLDDFGLETFPVSGFWGVRVRWWGSHINSG